jgi:hypothetical protein
LMVAAYYGHPAIVEQLVVARADLSTKNSIHGCALPRGPSGGLVGRRLCRLRLRRPAGTRRCTGRRAKAAPNPPWRCSSAAPTGPSRTTTGNAVLPTATPTGRTPNRPESAQANASPTRTSSQRARRVRRGGGGGAAAGIACALLLRPASHAMPRHTRSTAQTALFGIRRHTRGMMGASHCVVSAGVVGRQRVGREHSTLRLTVRGTAPPAAHTGTQLATHCEFGFARTPAPVGRGVCSSNG